jgi:hypothetical protein
MKFNLYNYEEYVLDYLEKNLSLDDSLAFDDFLSRYPQIKAQILACNTPFAPENIAFRAKDTLYWRNSISNSTNNDRLIAYLENEFNENQNINVRKWIESDASIKNQYLILQKTKLIPDVSIIYPEKNKLYKKSKLKPTILYALTMAASVALLLYFSIAPNNNIGHNYFSINWLIEKPVATINKNTEQSNADIYKHFEDIKITAKKEHFAASVTDVNDSLKMSELEMLSLKQNSLDTELSENKINLPVNAKAQQLLFDNQKSTAWQITEIAIQKLNRLTKKSIFLDNEYTYNGHISRLVIVAENFKYEREFIVE